MVVPIISRRMMRQQYQGPALVGGQQKPASHVTRDAK
jgi:hypothetical protein